MQFMTRILCISHNLFHCFKGFCADNVFHSAGVTDGCFFVDAERDKPPGDKPVPLIHSFSYFKAGRQKRYIAVIVHFDIAVFAQIFHSYAYARLAEIKCVHNVDRANRAFAVFNHQNCFQIIFGRFLYFQNATALQCYFVIV